ncbi:MAG: YraN family protein [Oscillospiraceae bacterium]|nr:YraN family protein [Oscillospiraceae bacterium]
MLNIKKIRGDFGEAAVCAYLTERGYEIIQTNYRKSGGEIDIIANNICYNDEIVFVEVKTRKFGSLIDGLESVTQEKRRRIVKTAGSFLRENPQFGGMNARFDVAAVIVTTEELPRVLEIEYIRDAFEPALL